jgi:hypothetical protein
LHVLLSREGWKVNHLRVYRLDRLQGLSLRLKTRKKHISGVRVALAPANVPNERWSMDFMSDSLYDRRRCRVWQWVREIMLNPASLRLMLEESQKEIQDRNHDLMYRLTRI